MTRRCCFICPTTRGNALTWPPITPEIIADLRQELEKHRAGLGARKTAVLNRAGSHPARRGAVL